MLFTGLYAGLAAGAILSFLAHIAPLVGAGNFIRDLDQPKTFGRELSRREAHLLVFSLFSGLLLAWFVAQGWIAGFDFLSVLGWGALMLLFVGLVLMPLEGHGLFGQKRDSWFVIDLGVACLLWSLLYWGLIKLWLPA
jgi:hypothetical protein